MYFSPANQLDKETKEILNKMMCFVKLMVDSRLESLLYQSWAQATEQNKSEKNVIYFGQHLVLKYVNISCEILLVLGYLRELLGVPSEVNDP